MKVANNANNILLTSSLHYWFFFGVGWGWGWVKLATLIARKTTKEGFNY